MGFLLVLESRHDLEKFEKKNLEKKVVGRLLT